MPDVIDSELIMYIMCHGNYLCVLHDKFPVGGRSHCDKSFSSWEACTGHKKDSELYNRVFRNTQVGNIGIFVLL